MKVQDLYGYVLTLVLIGLVMGVGMIVLGNFATASGITSAGSTAVNNTITAIAPIASTWLPIITIIAATAVILAMVLRSFRG